MQNVRLKRDLLIDAINHPEGDVVRVADARAADLIRGGFAERCEEGEVKNPGHNPLADSISPYPPGGANASPVDALLPEVDQNPGLVALETAARTGAPRRAAKVSGKAD